MGYTFGGSGGGTVQPSDADLTTIAALTPSNDDLLQAKSGAWTNRTVAQVKSDLALNNVDNTSDATQNAATATLTNKTISGASNTLSAIPESAVTSLTTDLAAKAATATTITAGTGLTGGGDLSANRTLTVAYGAAASTAVQGNDYRITDRRCGAAITGGGEWSCDRNFYVATAIPLVSGRLELTYFVATVTETINTLKVWTSGTAAASLTLCRYCVYTVAGNGDITLINSTVSDTALLAATNTAYPKALSASWSKTAGTLYAVGLLVTGTTMPTLCSDQNNGAQVGADLRFVEPRRSAYVTGLSDLPSPVVNASLLSTRRNAFVEMTP